MLNNIPIRRWDVAAGFRRMMFGNAHRGQFKCRSTGHGHKHSITSASCSEGIRILEKAAWQLVAREEAS